jgi:CubicO group peptidase (beta-lactamase class C family)
LFLSVDTVSVCVSPSAKRSHRWGVLGYGLGIQVSAREDLLELSHSGYVPGYISTLIYYPQQQVSVVVLENTAWLSSDISRVFSVHDRLREIIRNMIMG